MLITESKEELQVLVKQIGRICDRKRRKINVNKNELKK